MDRLELQMEVDAGLSIAQLATRFGCSKGSVRYWLGKYGLRTRNRPKRDSTPEMLAAREAGLQSFAGVCPRHGETEFVLRDGGTFRCGRCRVEAVGDRSRRVKDTLVRDTGGCCQICGYDRYPGALQFHHLDRSAKSFSFSRRGLATSIDSFREELRKCVLLCGNCHAEVEGGVTTLPIHYANRSGLPYEP